MSASFSRWRRMEENEERWFSLWCKVFEKSSWMMLYNPVFKDDPLMNHVTRFDIEDGFESEVDEAVKKFRSLDIDPAFYVSPLTKPGDAIVRLSELGFTVRDTMNIMEYRGEGETASVLNKIRIEKMGREGVEVWSRVYIEAFGIHDTQAIEVQRRVARIEQEEGIDLYLAFIKDRVAGGLALFSKDSVGGIYCVGTLPSYRNYGTATALLQKAVATSKDKGNRILCLQNLGSEGYEEFYNRRGFQTAFVRQIYMYGVYSNREASFS